ncbi:MAG: hypothetical protein NT124_00535 [Candidatus Dependentiae bacterium]|nr:hypothetical protein [Candidatus Dependentiae bacterium]
MIQKIVRLLCLLILVTNKSYCAKSNYPGSLDRSFGDNGIVISNNGQLFGVATQTSNAIIVAGDNINPSIMVAHAVTIDPTDGDIFLAGSVTNDAGFDNFAVARLNSAGILDTNFGALVPNGNGLRTGIATNSFGATTASQAQAIALDGTTLVVGGFAQTAGQQKRFALARYNISNGALLWQVSVPFTPNSPMEQINSIAIDRISSPQKIVVAGQSTILNLKRFVLARYNSSTGSLDTSFGTNGKTVTDFSNLTLTSRTDDSAQALVINNNANGLVPENVGFITAAGYTVNNEGEPFFALAYYDKDGKPDDSRGTFLGTQITEIGTISNQANAMAMYTSGAHAGKIVVVGSTQTALSKSTSKSNVSCFAVARYDFNGQLDITFGDSDGNGQRTGTVITSFDAENAIATGVAIDANNRIVVAGYVTRNGEPLMALARYNS